MKIKLHLAIRSLNIGGAEKQFITLVQNLDKDIFELSVSTMYGGLQEDKLSSLKNVNYYNLAKKGRYDVLGFYAKYKKLLTNINPDIIYSFKEEMNVFSYLCKPKQTKIIWGFRSSNMDLTKYGKVSQLLSYLQKRLSKNIDMIISNSYASILHHKSLGYTLKNHTVVANGIDINLYKKNLAYREKFRKKHHLKSSDIAIGIVARIDQMKGYTVFVKSAKNILELYNNVYFFAVGDGDIKIKKECESILKEFNHTKFIWLEKQLNMEKIYSGLDISTSSSIFGEGFSNSIAEAMSCSLPCIVTDVGDSRYIVKNTGEIVKPNDVQDLTKGFKKLLNSDYQDLGIKANERIVNNFSVDKMVQNTKQVVKELYEN